MTTTATWAAHDQADCASLTVGGKFYRCYAYLNNANGTRVEAVCFDEQENGQSVMVFRNIVGEPIGESDVVDCPKILASGNTFVVHWINVATLGNEIYRATMDMTNFSLTAWTARGGSALHADLLYDHAPVIGHASDFVVTRKAVAAATVNTARYNGYDWVDLAWSTNTAVTIAPRVLGVYAHEADNDVLISYQNTGGAALQLWSTRMNASDGLGGLSAITLNSFPDAQYVQVGHCRSGANEVVVVASAELDSLLASNPDRSCQWLAYGQINTNTAADLGTEHSVSNVNMVSRPWGWDNGSAAGGGGPDIYCMLSYKSVTDPDGWHQAKAFAVNMNVQHWESGSSIRPRIIAMASSVGVPDARVSGITPAPGLSLYGEYPAKRMNHLGTPTMPPTFGPDRRAVTIPTTLWARFAASHTTDPTIGIERTEFLPEGAGVIGYKIFMEDPWLYPREGTEADQSVNFHAAYPYAMHQSVEAGRGLVVAGGVPSIFDGTQMVEIGYPWAPEILGHADSGVLLGGAGLDAGEYQVYACYVWHDHQGQVHRSAPSKVYTFRVTLSNRSITYRVRTMTMSLKGESWFYPMGQPIVIEVYRTEAFSLAAALADPLLEVGNVPIGGPFYRVYGDEAAASLFQSRDVPTNDPTYYVQDVLDEVDNADLIYNGLGPYQLNLNSGISPAPPSTIPSMSVVTQWRNRIWMASGEAPNTVWYSKELLLDYGSDFFTAPEFIDANAITLDSTDAITAMQEMGDVLVVFTRAGIWTLSGDGNNGNGFGANLQWARRHEGTGCIDPRSLVLAPPGIFFQSHKGYYLLDLSFQLDHVSAGANVEDFLRDGGNVHDATLLEDRHQVRLVVNGRPGYTRTVTYDITGNPGADTYTFDFDGYDVVYERPDLISDTAAAAAAASAIAAVIDRGEALYGIVASATNSGDDVAVSFAENVLDVVYAPTAAGGGVFSLTSDVTVLTDAHPTVLIYDYQHRLWSEARMVRVSSTERSNQLVSGCAWRGYGRDIAHVALHEGGLHIERSADDSSPYTDSTSVADVGVPIDVMTSWIHLAGVAGLKRIWEIGIIGDRREDAAVNVDVEYDDDGSFTGITPAMDTFTWASPGPSYMPMKPTYQQVSGVRVRIYESVGIVNSDTVAITGIVFEVGMQRGPRRVADTQRGT